MADDEFGKEIPQAILRLSMNPSLAPQAHYAAFASEFAKHLFAYLSSNKRLVWFVAAGFISSINGGVELVKYIGSVIHLIIMELKSLVVIFFSFF